MTIFCFATVLCLSMTAFSYSDFAYAEENEDDNGEIQIKEEDVLESPIYCPHAECVVEGTMQAGSLVEVTISNFEEGYALDCVLISSGGVAISSNRSGNRYSFVMPEGKITIKVIFKESVPVTADKKTLGTKEIVAICVAGAIIVAGVFFAFFKDKPIFKKEKK